MYIERRNASSILIVDAELVTILSFSGHVPLFFFWSLIVNNLLKMSSSDKKRRKSFLNKLRYVFKRKDDELEEQSGACKQEKIFSEQTDHLRSASSSSEQKVSNEKCVTVPKNNLSTKEEHKDKNLSDMPESCKNIVRSENSRFPNVDDDISEEHQNYNVTKNKQRNSKLGSDRHMSTKIAFLKQDNDIDVNSRSSPGNTGKMCHDNGTKSYSPDSKNAILQSLNNATVTSGTRKFLVKETKTISQENSEDSDFSADSTEDSFEDSSEDENEHLESEKARIYFKDEYFTKGKYITYFFLEMERQFYNPTDVYSMVQYHAECQKPKKEGTQRYTKFITLLKIYNSFVFC